MDWETWLHDYAGTWHDTFEILGALGSAAAAIVAVWLASRERADRKIAEKDRDAARAAQREAEQAESRRARESQARAIPAWTSFRVVDPVTDSESGVVRHLGHQREARVANFSEMPVFEVVPVLILEEGDEWNFGGANVLRPGEETSFDVPAKDHKGRPSTVSVLAVDFKDAAGTPWRRHTTGRLEDRTAQYFHFRESYFHDPAPLSGPSSVDP